MQLSILVPTYRQGIGVVGRIAQACSWARPDIEVIVRDNSGNAKKRELISQFRGDHCNIVIVDRCEPFDNFLETFRLAKGEFTFMVADDDLCFDRAIEALPRFLEQFGNDTLVAGFSGHYAIETSQGTIVTKYADVDSDDVLARVTGFLRNPGPNALFYTVLRRELVERMTSFMRRMPVFLSFHDQILVLLYLLCGKFIQMPRLLYAYDLGVWESGKTGQQRDIDFYIAAGLDSAINQLHWILCGFEGAVLVRNSDLFPDYPLARRQAVADLWFSMMFARFQAGGRLTGESKFANEAGKVRAKLLTSIRRISFQNMLAEICSLIALFAPDKAQHYHDFWDAQINKRAATVRRDDVYPAGAERVERHFKSSDLREFAEHV
jgi:hypothetical protein